jgi:DNA/RNA-binding domain of Phe-tRNA-synthetase-like protein
MQDPELVVDSHPVLELAVFITSLEETLGALASPEWLTAGLALDADMPLTRSEEIRTSVRDLLRHGGYKPTGRGKPSSEYLVRAAGAGKLNSINAAVDACNVVSLHSGLPISLIDLDRAQGPLQVRIAESGARFVFNRSGQEIDLSGLLCLHDSLGPIANAVKDCQRTKTDDDTQNTLSLVWGTSECAGLAARASAWYRELLERCGATTRSL